MNKSRANRPTHSKIVPSSAGPFSWRSQQWHKSTKKSAPHHEPLCEMPKKRILFLDMPTIAHIQWQFSLSNSLYWAIHFAHCEGLFQWNQCDATSVLTEGVESRSRKSNKCRHHVFPIFLKGHGGGAIWAKRALWWHVKVKEFRAITIGCWFKGAIFIDEWPVTLWMWIHFSLAWPALWVCCWNIDWDGAFEKELTESIFEDHVLQAFVMCVHLAKVDNDVLNLRNILKGDDWPSCNVLLLLPVDMIGVCRESPDPSLESFRVRRTNRTLQASIICHSMLQNFWSHQNEPSNFRRMSYFVWSIWALHSCILCLIQCQGLVEEQSKPAHYLVLFLFVA